MAADAKGELLDLLRQLRGASGLLERARLLREGAGVLRGLSPDEQRSLAVEVASLAAPELVPRIEAEGRAPLSGEQVRALLDMIRGLDADQVEQLRQRVADPDARGQLLDEVAHQVVAAPEAAPPPAVADASTVDEPVAAAPAEHAATEQTPTGAAIDASDAGSEPTTAGSMPTRAFPDPHAAGAALDVEPAPVDAFELSMPEMASWEPDRLSADAFEFAPPPSSSAAPVEAGHRHDRIQTRLSSRPNDAVVATHGNLPSTKSPVRTGNHLAQELAQLPGGPQRLRRLRRAIGEDASLACDDAVAVAQQFADGWLRRRAVDMLLRDGADPRCVPRLIDTLARATDREWAAGTAVQLDVLGGNALDALVNHRVAERLRRRGGAHRTSVDREAVRRD